LPKSTLIRQARYLFRRNSGTGILTISVTPFFASAWLIPRLNDFQSHLPEIDLQVLTGKGLVDFSRDGVDVAVRHGLGRYSELISKRLFAVEILPVAAPALVERFSIPASPTDLTRSPMSKMPTRRTGIWGSRRRGLTILADRAVRAFDDSGMLLTAGACRARRRLVPAAMAALDLAEGLVKLANVTLPEAYAYYLVLPGGEPRTVKGRCFSEMDSRCRNFEGSQLTASSLPGYG
jgi:LysR family glycine cleavage system transcriptional activator